MKKYNKVGKVRKNERVIADRYDELLEEIEGQMIQKVNCEVGFSMQNKVRDNMGTVANIIQDKLQDELYRRSRKKYLRGEG